MLIKLSEVLALTKLRTIENAAEELDSVSFDVPNMNFCQDLATKSYVEMGLQLTELMKLYMTLLKKDCIDVRKAMAALIVKDKNISEIIKKIEK